MEIKEILLLHHSHLDVGYTHTQQIVWELQNEFMDLAIKLLDDTKDYPEYAKPKWTVEVTAQIMHWLKTASANKVDQLKKYVAEGRIGFSGLKYNTTPLVNAEGLARQLYDEKYINENLGADIKTVNQHDVNGLPWSSVDLMIDAGIELFIMAINRHLGGKAVKRPSVFRWEGPSGREVFAMNGAHYTMFDQLLYTWENSIERMEEGLKEYYDYLEKAQYDLDFIYLTTAAAPVCWDNAPPNIDVAKLVAEWNERGKMPLIRYITPNELLDRIKQNPVDKYPVHCGDWTDFWNFGCGATAFQTKLGQIAKSKMQKAELLHSFNGKDKYHYPRINKEAWENIFLADEHAWGSFNSMDADCEFTRIQFCVKEKNIYDAHELSEYLLVDEMEDVTGNPENYETQDGVFAFNPSGKERTEYLPVPDWWFEEGKRRSTTRYGWPNRVDQMQKAPLYGPVKLAPYSYSKIKMTDLVKAKEDDSLKTGEYKIEEEGRRLNVLDTVKEEFIIKFIESDFYRIEFNHANCRITRVYDKVNDWEILDKENHFTFFQFVQEKTDPLFRDDRRAYYARDLEKEKFDIQCWVTDWKRIRTTAFKPLGYEIEKNPANVVLILSFEVPGCDWFKQKFILHKNKAHIEIKIEMMKQDVRTPESIYLTTPLNLKKDWECTFDTAGVPTKLDDEQIAGCSRDWFTVEKYVAMCDSDKCAALFCPHAPMIQAGGFNFGNNSAAIPRNEKPLLVAWPLNNYWDTNFRPSQPGYIDLSYYFKSYNNFDEAEVFSDAEEVVLPVEVHSFLDMKEEGVVPFLKMSGDKLKLLHCKKADGGDGVILRLINLDDKNENYKIEFPGREVKEAFTTKTFEDITGTLPVENGAVNLNLTYKRITTIKVKFG